MTTGAYTQLFNGSQYRVFSEAAPANSVYGTEPFFWDLAQDAFLTANNITTSGADVWQFEYATGKYIRTAGGGTMACATSTVPTELSGHWKLIPDGVPVGGIQYYLLQSRHNAARYMYFNPDDHKLYTKDADLPDDNTRKYYRVGFVKNVAPVLNVSIPSLPFSSAFLSKNVTVSGENIAADITLTVPAGITLSGANVVNSNGNYSIAAANGNGDNTITITADTDEGIDGVLVVASAGATSRTVALKSGVKQGAWYNLKLVHVSENWNLSLKDEPAVPTLKAPEATLLDQLFTFIPIAGKNETFRIKNGHGVYLLSTATGAVSYGASTGTSDEEWTIDRQNGQSDADYFRAFTLKTGSRATNPYLGHGTTGVDVNMAATYPIDTKGTYRLIIASSPTDLNGVADEKASVYANSNRQIVITGKIAAVVSVYNLTGQKIAGKTLETSGTFVDVSDAGIYIVNISGNGINKTQKIILK
jgi:hypothetical protein